MNATPKTVVGVDTAKSVFQVYTIEAETGEVINKPIKRAQFLPNVVIVALANKMARTIWAVLAHERAYGKDHVSMRPHAALAT